MSEHFDQSTRGTYVNVFQNDLEITVPEGTQGAKQRTTKNGKIKTYVAGDRMVGHIKDVRFHRHQEYGDSITIHFLRKQKNYLIRLPVTGGAANGFFQVMESIDYECEVAIEPSYYNERQYLNFEQHGKRIDWNYTRENPNGKPEWDFIVHNGQRKPDRTKELNFYYSKLKPIVAKLRSIHDIARGPKTSFDEVPQQQPVAHQQPPIQQNTVNHQGGGYGGFPDSTQEPVTQQQTWGATTPDDDLPF